MGTSDFAAVTVQVPIHHVGGLKDLLREHPALSFFRRGWIVATFAIIGPPGEMAAFQPKLARWQRDCEAGDAW